MSESLTVGLFAHLLAEDLYASLYGSRILEDGYDFDKRNSIEAVIMKFMDEHKLAIMRW